MLKVKSAWLFVFAKDAGYIGFPGICADLYFSSPEKFAELWGRPLGKAEWLLPVTVPVNFDDWDYVPRDY